MIKSLLLSIPTCLRKAYVNLTLLMLSFDLRSQPTQPNSNQVPSRLSTFIQPLIRFDWLESVSEQTSFEHCGADSLYIHVNRDSLREIGICKLATVKLTLEALSLFENTKTLNLIKKITMAPTKTYNAVPYDYTPTDKVALPDK